MDIKTKTKLSDIFNVAFWGVLFMWCIIVTITAILDVPIEISVPVFPYAIYLLFAGFGLKFASLILCENVKKCMTD